jgi:hypothetical protein
MLFPLQESGTVAMAVETTLHVYSLGCLRHCLILCADGLFRGLLVWSGACRNDILAQSQVPYVVRAIVFDTATSVRCTKYHAGLSLQYGVSG